MSDHAIPQYTWVVHPLLNSWKRSILLSVFLSLFFLGIYWSFQSVPVMLLSAFFLVGSLYRYFLPFRYEFHEDGLVVTSLFYRMTKSWSTFRSFYVDRNGVLLSPFSKPSRLENFRGVYVRFGANREEVVAYIERKISSSSQE